MKMLLLALMGLFVWWLYLGAPDDLDLFITTSQESVSKGIDSLNVTLPKFGSVDEIIGNVIDSDVNVNINTNPSIGGLGISLYNELSLTAPMSGYIDSITYETIAVGGNICEDNWYTTEVYIDSEIAATTDLPGCGVFVYDSRTIDTAEEPFTVSFTPFLAIGGKDYMIGFRVTGATRGKYSLVYFRPISVHYTYVFE